MPRFGELGAKESCEAFAVRGGCFCAERPRARCFSALSLRACALSFCSCSPGTEVKYEGVLGVRGIPRLGAPLIESLDSVLDELYDDLWSVDSVEAGVREGLGVAGVCVAGVGSGEMVVSSVSPDTSTSFLEEVLPMRRNDFQLGELGPGDGRECIDA